MGLGRSAKTRAPKNHIPKLIRQDVFDNLVLIILFVFDALVSALGSSPLLMSSQLLLLKRLMPQQMSAFVGKLFFSEQALCI